MKVKVVKHIDDLDSDDVGRQVRIPTINGDFDDGIFFGFSEPKYSPNLGGGAVTVRREGEGIYIIRRCQNKKGEFPRREGGREEGVVVLLSKSNPEYERYHAFLRSYKK